MDFIPILETPKINYTVPPKICNSILELCNNKGKKLYMVDFLFIRNCDINYPDECIHTIDIEIYRLDLDPLSQYSRQYEKITFENVRYEDLQNLGYTKHLNYKLYKSKDICKLC